MTRKFMPSKDLTDGPQRDADLKTKAQTKDKCVKFCVCVCVHIHVHMACTGVSRGVTIL